MANAERTGKVAITFKYSRNFGPKHVIGGLTLEFDSTQPYAFVSRAKWPGLDNLRKLRSGGR